VIINKTKVLEQRSPMPEGGELILPEPEGAYPWSPKSEGGEQRSPMPEGGE
jgi:hypothetical protein